MKNLFFVFVKAIINRLSFILIIFFCTSLGFCQDEKINKIYIFAYPSNVYFNKLIFGNNLIGAPDPSLEQKYYGYIKFGEGVWDANRHLPNKMTLSLLRGAGIAALRFPGGCGSHAYDWKEQVNSQQKKIFGFLEFLTICEKVNAEPIITLSYFTGDEIEDIDFVSRLNNRVKYFEVGNEIYHGNHRDIASVAPEEYAERYLKYYAALKKSNKNIFVGLVLLKESWNVSVMSRVRDRLDFGIVHFYPQSSSSLISGGSYQNDGFLSLLAKPQYEIEPFILNTLDLLKEKAGRSVPLAITEYNGGFQDEKSTAFRHSLGNALLNSELLRIFLKPQSNIIMANYWNFANEYWGMVANGFDGTPKTLYNPYYKRPNYYVFEMYNKHFGDYLLDSQVFSKTYDYKNTKIPYLSVNASKSKDGNKVYLMVINKNMDEAMTSTIDLKDFVPTAKGYAWVLNGPSVDATNEKKHDNVKVTQHEFEINGNPFEFIFEPHSLTAIELRKLE